MKRWREGGLCCSLVANLSKTSSHLFHINQCIVWRKVSSKSWRQSEILDAWRLSSYNIIVLSFIKGKFKLSCSVADPVFFRSASTTGFRLSAYPFFILCLEPCIKGCKRSKLEQSVPDKIVRIRVSLKDSNTVRYTADSLSGMNSISLSRCIIH